VRILLITSTPPIPSSGGSIVLYRHFCERNDFEISVVTDNVQICQYSPPYEFSLLESSPLWNRILRTRLSKVLHSVAHLLFGNRIPQKVFQQAKAFNPDAVLTVAGSWSWTARLAKRVAQQLEVPLIVSFMDWWFYNQIYAQWAAPYIEAQFRHLYRQCDLALCISEGMKEALGEHDNAVVLYPIGSPLQHIAQKSPPSSQSFTIAFTGNLSDWYGRMLEPLLIATEGDDIHFQLYGPSTSWSEDFEAQARRRHLYRGYLPRQKLLEELQQVDALFLMMGFGSDCAQVEKTSFKSKFLEYLAFQKPVLVWGPDYCSAVNCAREFDAAEICTSPDPQDFLETIRRVQKNPYRQQQLVVNARKMYEERFHPEKIHQHFVTKLKELVA
jgi:glycosyltransferase involved in cell wall biosynthesis